MIDTTEMYLRTILELEEEGFPPLRARIVERIGHRGPTVSQTVARLERDGLVHLKADRRLELSALGRRRATAVMRKHRLAERLLYDVMGLAWDQIHLEACRWEHVMSVGVEKRIVMMITEPFVCPHGNPIPGLSDLGVRPASQTRAAAVALRSAAGSDSDTTLTVEWLSEQLQQDDALLRMLFRADVVPGADVIARLHGDDVRLTTSRTAIVISSFTARRLFVSPALPQN